MHIKAGARTLSQSSRYICLSCQLRHPALFLAQPAARRYATKDSPEVDEAVNAAAPGLKPPKTRKKKKLKASSAEAETKDPDDTIKHDVANDSPTKASKKSSPTVSKHTGRPRKKIRLSPEEAIALQDEADQLVANLQSAQATRSTKGKKPAVEADAGTGKEAIEALDRVNAGPHSEASTKTLLHKLIAVSKEPDKVSPRVRKVRRLAIRRVRSLGLRKISKTLRIRRIESLPLRKVSSAEKPSKATSGFDEDTKHEGRVRKRREAVTGKSLQETTMTAVGLSIKDAMKAGSMQSDEQLPRLKAADTQLHVIPVEQPPVPVLAHGLERVLFNPGVYQLRDPRTRTFNFDPHLEKLMPVRDFNFDSLNIFTPPSKDETLANIARDSAKKYVASTSSLTGTLKQLHYLLSSWRPINFDMLSKTFPVLLTSFTRLQRAPEAIFLRWKDGVYATDSDKFYDSANVLSLMGRYMEKLLTLGKEGFFRHKVGSQNPITEKERAEPEAFHYSTLGDFVLRSQLDAYDSRLPGSGVFDLKTRAVIPIRMDSGDYEWGTDYEIRSLKGEWQSFEREYHDMIRSTMLKYSLQVRMGRMDGIFMAFHNIARIFGFQYVSLEEMDYALHGQWDRTLGDQEFHLSLRLLNEVFNRTTERFPKTSIRFHIETRPPSSTIPFMYIFAEPVTEDQAEGIQTANRHKIEEWERSLLHGGPTEEGQARNAELAEQARKDAEAKRAADEKAAEDAAYNVEQDVTSQYLPQTEKDKTLKDLRQKEYDTSKKPDVHTKDTAPAKDDAPTDKGPLAAYVLTITNHVNGKRVPRPRHLKSTDTWELAYSLVNIDSPTRAWTLYDMCKARRHKEMSAEKKTQKENAYFKNMLKRITAEGKRWRDGIEEREDSERREGREPRTVWEEPKQDECNRGEKKKRTLGQWLFGSS